jgi:hypothetical protein
MEFLLLWADELDDALGALRHLWPQVVDFLTATLLFAMTGFGLMLATQATVFAVVAVVAATLLEVSRHRRLRRSMTAIDDTSRDASSPR